MATNRASLSRTLSAGAEGASWPGAHPQHLLDGLHAVAEQVHVELLKPRARDAGVEVQALEKVHTAS